MKETQKNLIEIAEMYETRRSVKLSTVSRSILLQILPLFSCADSVHEFFLFPSHLQFSLSQSHSNGDIYSYREIIEFN